MIVLVRCDDRLIHGQCMTVIVKDYKIKDIIVIDDYTAKNQILKAVFEAAVPSNMSARVYTLDEGIPKIESAFENDARTLVLMKSPVVYYELREKIKNFPNELNIGPMSKRKGTTEVQATSHLLPTEAQAIKDAVANGAHVYFQQVPKQPRVEWDEVKNRF